MTEGVNKASTVVVLCSKAYKFSQAARSEAMHASTLRKQIVCLQVEDWQGDGWLKHFMSDKPTISKDLDLNDTFEALLQYLGPSPSERLKRTRSRTSSLAASDSGVGMLARTRSRSFHHGSSEIAISEPEESDSRITMKMKQQRARAKTMSAVRFHASSRPSADDNHSTSSSKDENKPLQKEEWPGIGDVTPISPSPRSLRRTQSVPGGPVSDNVARSSQQNAVDRPGMAAKPIGIPPSSTPSPSHPRLSSLRDTLSLSRSISAISAVGLPGICSPSVPEQDLTMHEHERLVAGVSLQAHVQLLHTTAQKDIDMVELRAEHQAEKIQKEHELALMQAKQSMAEVHRLEVEAMKRSAELRETKLLAMVAVAAAVGFIALSRT